MSGPPVALPLPRVVPTAVRRWPRSAWTVAVCVVGIAAMGVIVGIATAVVLVAAERPSFLSGPAQHGFPAWMVGPLAHLLPRLPNSPPMLQADLTRALALLGIAWIVAAICASRVPATLVWIAVVAAQAVLLLGPPLSLTDVFNYLHYGRMGATYGLNPYVALPLAAPQDPAYRFSNWHHLPSPYGPLFTLLTEGLAPLHLATAYWSWKVLLLAASIGMLVLVAVTAKRLGRSPQAAVAFVGLNPLVLVYGIGGDHNEPLMLLCAVAAVTLATFGRDEDASPWLDAGAGACAVLAAGFKPSAALLIPVVVLACRRRLPALGGGGRRRRAGARGRRAGLRRPPAEHRHPGPARQSPERAQRARRPRRPRRRDRTRPHARRRRARAGGTRRDGSGCLAARMAARRRGLRDARARS